MNRQNSMLSRQNSMLSRQNSKSTMNSSRKYQVVQPLSPSPLARDSTAVMPVRLKKKDSFSFSTASHTHGIGGEAKDAMLRNSGIRMRRTTSSLRVVATKGNATLSAAFSHKVFVPELELFLRNYARKEDEFAECIPSAMCPFQFVQHDTSDTIVPSFQRKMSQGDVKDAIDPTKLHDWLTDMRLKVHMRLVQRQVTTVSTPTEGHKLDDNKRVMTPTKSERDDKKGAETERKKGSETSRKKGSESDRKKQESDRKKRDLLQDMLEVVPAVTRSNSEKKVPALSRSPSNSKANAETRKAQRKSGMSSRTSAPSGSAHPFDIVGNQIPGTPVAGNQIGGNQPLFVARKNPSLTRRTHSAYDVRRVRLKARNSVGMEPW